MLTGVEYDYNLEVTSRLARTKLAPLYFVRSGYIHLSVTAGTFRYAGQLGFERSSRTSPTSGTLAYYLQVDVTIIYSSQGPYNRYYGFPLRCLSTILDM